MAVLKNEEIEELFYQTLEEYDPGSKTRLDHWCWDVKIFFIWPDENWSEELEKKMEASLKQSFHKKTLISCLYIRKA